jgi:tetratricopeptide (TPR) repeat protein
MEIYIIVEAWYRIIISFDFLIFFLIKALQYHEDYAEALASYERALELDSENEDARNNQDQLLSYLRTITDLIACKVCLKSLEKKRRFLLFV